VNGSNWLKLETSCYGIGGAVVKIDGRTMWKYYEVEYGIIMHNS